MRAQLFPLFLHTHNHFVAFWGMEEVSLRNTARPAELLTGEFRTIKPIC